MIAPPPNDKPARKRRRLWLAAGALVVLAGAGAALAPWTVSRGALREAMIAQLQSTLGLHVFTNGRTAFSLLPRPHVRMLDIAFVDPTGALVVQARELHGALRIAPLLAGKLELSEAVLAGPRIELDVEGKPMRTAGAAARAAEARPQTSEAEKADRARLGVVAISDGALELRRNGKIEERFEKINALLDWRIVQAPASFSGDAQWRGRPVSLSFWLARPAELLRGEASTITAQARAPEFEVSANGPMKLGPRPQFEGRVVASTASARRLFELFGAPAPTLLGRGPASFDGQTNATLEQISLTDAKFNSGSNAFVGALALQFEDGRATLSGSLAAQSFSFNSAMADAPGLIGADRHFSRETFEPRAAGLFDIDLRLSAREARLGGLRAQNLAGSILQKDGKQEFSIAEAQMYKGTVKARLSLEPQEALTRVRGNIIARGLDWGAVDWEQFGDAHLAGQADLTLQLEGAGASPDQIARNATGQGEFALTTGEIIGLDVERILKRMDRRPLSSAVDLRAGRTQFDKAHVDFKIEDGEAKLLDANVEGQTFTMSVEGAAQLAERQMKLKATVWPKSSKGEETEKQKTPAFALDIGGPWDNPRMTPDALGFIRRSGAAKPLIGPRQEKSEQNKIEKRETSE
jgi:AsmA protein